MDPSHHQNLRFALELLAFLSNIVVATVAILALIQIVFAKRALDTARSDIELRSKREAVTLAADRCAVFAEKILPHCAAELKAIAAEGVKIKNWTLENTKFDKSSIKDWSEAKKWLDALNPGQRDKASAILNFLESFAIYFAEGAADERVAYSTVGPVFQRYVDRLAPYIILLRVKEATVATGSFQNIVTLYEIWTVRARKELLESQQATITNQLSGIHDSHISPIGTKRNYL